MDEKPLYAHIFNLLDYADVVYPLITADAQDKEGYFMTLVFIERVLDNYGRGFVSVSARDSGMHEEYVKEMLHLANRRMDELRANIRKLSQIYDFDETLHEWGAEMYRNWHKMPEEEF